MSEEDALADLSKRISNYEKVYETIENDSVSYIKLINLQSKVSPSSKISDESVKRP